MRVLTELGLADTLKFLIRRFGVKAKMQFAAPPNLDPGQLETRLAAKEGIVAPWGSYYHEADFWAAGDRAAPRASMEQGLRNPNPAPALPVEQLLNVLLPETGTPDLATVDPGWPASGLPADGGGATVRDYLAGPYAKALNRINAAQGADTPGAALTALLAEAQSPRGLSPLRAGPRARPQGAFGEHGVAGPASLPDGEALRTAYPRGVFPPKFRDWDEIITRRYETMDELLAAEAGNGPLELRGAVFVRKIETTRNIQYHGRGILVTATEDAGAPAVLGGTVTPAEPGQPADRRAPHQAGAGRRRPPAGARAGRAVQGHGGQRDRRETARRPDHRGRHAGGGAPQQAVDRRQRHADREPRSGSRAGTQGLT